MLLRAHLINSCNAPVMWPGGVFAWPIDSFLQKSWRRIARCRMEGREGWGITSWEMAELELLQVERRPLWVNEVVDGRVGNFTLWFLWLKDMWLTSQPPSTCRTASSFSMNNTNTFINRNKLGPTLPNSDAQCIFLWAHPSLVRLMCLLCGLRGEHHSQKLCPNLWLKCAGAPLG